MHYKISTPQKRDHKGWMEKHKDTVNNRKQIAKWQMPILAWLVPSNVSELNQTDQRQRLTAWFKTQDSNMLSTSDTVSPQTHQQVKSARVEHTMQTMARQEVERLHFRRNRSDKYTIRKNAPGDTGGYFIGKGVPPPLCWFWNITKSKWQEKKNINWTSLKSYVLRKTWPRKIKENLWNGRNYLQIIFPIQV